MKLVYERPIIHTGAMINDAWKEMKKLHSDRCTRNNFISRMDDAFGHGEEIDQYVSDTLEEMYGNKKRR